MEKVRIGNDLKVNFSVYRNGEPESFDGATNISTKIVNESYNKTIAHTYAIVDNVIQFNIDALELKQCGKCRVFISYTKAGDYTVDSPAFELVQYTEDTGGTEVIGIEIVKINISGDIGINRDGASAYEVWEAYPGNEGKTIEQYFEWLHENPTKVDTSRTITAGDGLTGGGDLTEDRTINVVNTDDSIVVSANGIKVDTQDTLTSDSASKPLSAKQGKLLQDNKAEKTRNIVAGAGLTGGGDLTADRTINVATADDSLTVTADNIKVNTNNTLTSTSTTQPLSANQGKVLNEKVVQVETDLNGKIVDVTRNFGYIGSEIQVQPTVSGVGGINGTTGVIETNYPQVVYSNQIAFESGDIIKITSYTFSRHAIISSLNNGIFTPILGGVNRGTSYYIVSNIKNLTFCWIQSEGIVISKVSNPLSKLASSGVAAKDLISLQNSLVEVNCEYGLILANGKTINTVFDEFRFSNYFRVITGATINCVMYQVQNTVTGKFIGVFFYDSKLNLIGTIENVTRSRGTVTLTNLNTPSEAVYFRFQTTVNYTDKSIFGCLNCGKNNMPGDFDTINIPTIYVRNMSALPSSFKLNNNIYPEGIIQDVKLNCTIFGGKEYPIPTSSGIKYLNVEAEGRLSKTISFNTIVVNPENVINKKAFVMCIGESTTVAQRPNPFTRQYDKFWGWVSAMQYFNLLDKDYYTNGNDIRTIGHSNNRELGFTFNGHALVNRSFLVGASGRPSYWLLHYPIYGKLGTQTSDRLYSETLWYFLGLATKTPYYQTEYNANVETYTGSDSQIALITSTSAGFYKIDGHVLLWNLIRDSLPTSELYDSSQTITGTYVGSSGQINLLQNWFEAKADNPYNPFYDKAKVRNNTLYSDVAFSMDKYLDRYRTMDNMGNRLVGSAGQSVVGDDGNTYNIGTLVTDTTLFDVCTPTHVVFNIGINDSEYNSVENAVLGIKKLVNVTTLPCAYFICRYSGVCSPSMWTEVAKCDKFNGNEHSAKLLNDIKPWFDTQSNKYLLPAYQVQYPCSSDGEYLIDDLITENKKIYTPANIHTSYHGYKSIGLQVLNWLYSTL